jgi:thiol-disulfide isomerase/thioredoxin
MAMASKNMEFAQSFNSDFIAHFLFRSILAMSTKLTRVILTSASAFEAAVQEHAAKSKAGGPALFLLFTGAKDPSSGASWCPDCSDAAPVVDSVFAEAAEASEAGVTLLELHLDRAEWKGLPPHPAHPFRTHPAFKVQRIPTLVRWGARGKVGELVEDGCKDAGLVKELVME